MHIGYDVYCDMVTDDGGWLVRFQQKYVFTISLLFRRCAAKYHLRKTQIAVQVFMKKRNELKRR